MREKRILLIGGAGFLGSHIAKALQASGFEVAVLDRINIAPPGIGIEQFVGDLRDMHLLRSAISKYPRVVYLVHEASIAPAADLLAANFLGNIELFLGVLGVARECLTSEFFLLSSGGAVYGEPEAVPISETHPKNPRSPYGIAKLTMEKYLAMAAERDGFRHVAIRPSNPYGPGQNFRSAQGIVAVAMSRIVRDEPITIRGDGSARKDYIFVEDFALACARLISTPSAVGPFNIGSGVGIPLVDIIAAIERTVGKASVLDFAAAQAGDVSTNILDISKIHSTTGWLPSTSLADGLAKTWGWINSRIAKRTGAGQAGESQYTSP